MFLRLETAKINLQRCVRERERGRERDEVPGISGVSPGEVGGDLVLQHVEALVLQGLNLRLLPQARHVWREKKDNKENCSLYSAHLV